MTLSAKEAAEIARANGLTLTDAAALARLATTPEEAREAASVFTRTVQLTRADLAGMTAEQINASREAGQLDELMGKS
jgi:hypothetical protein